MTLLVSALILFAVVALLWRGLSADERKTDKKSEPHWPMRRAMSEALTEFSEDVTPGRGAADRKQAKPEGGREPSAVGASPAVPSPSPGASLSAEASRELTAREPVKGLRDAGASREPVSKGFRDVEASRELAPGKRRVEKRHGPHRAEASRELTPERPSGGKPALAAAMAGAKNGAEASEEFVRRGDEAAIAVRALSEGGEETDGWQAAYSDSEPFSLRRTETATDSALPNADSVSAAAVETGARSRRLDAEFSLELAGSAEKPRAARGAFAAANRSARQESFKLREEETMTEAASELAPGTGLHAGAGVHAGAATPGAADPLAANAAALTELQKQFDSLSDELATMQLTVQTLQVLSELEYQMGRAAVQSNEQPH